MAKLNHEQTTAKEITQAMREAKIKIVDGNGDVWHVTPKTLFTKQSRELNRLLGLHKINKGKK